MTRVLVTGARGLLGSTLVPHLQARGHTVLRLGRAGEVEVRADLCDVDQVFRALDKAKPDVIMNLAALADVDECERSTQSAYLMNVRIVENLADWIKRSGTHCHLIQISTDQVYEGSGPHAETDIRLTNFYGFSKYAGELAAAVVPSTILRTNFFGPSRCPGRTSLSDWLVQALTNGDAITVFDDARFSPLSLQHLAELLEPLVEKRLPGIYNLGSAHGMSKADFAFVLAEVLGLPTANMRRGNSGQAALTAYRPQDMRMDSLRFETAFGVRLPALSEEIQSMKAAYARKAS